MQEHLSLPVQFDGIARPGKQGRSQLGLQPFDRGGKAGCGDEKFPGGFGDLAAFGDGLEVIELQQFHNSSLLTVIGVMPEKFMSSTERLRNGTVGVQAQYSKVQDMANCRISSYCTHLIMFQHSFQVMLCKTKCI